MVALLHDDPIITPARIGSDYATFLAGKRRVAPMVGFSVAEAELHSKLFDWQRQIVAWAIQRGRAALFEGTGLGKTLQQLAWAYHVHQHTGKDVLILAPLGVTYQTAYEEAPKLDLTVTVCRSQADVRPGINITNYEMLHQFESRHFAGVVLDEGSILKNYVGVTKRALCAAFADTPYRLVCTATPAPNELVELGNYAEFLGIMPANEMLTRFFINDTQQAQHFRLKGHAARDFWEWVASWAVTLRRPSDLGYPDDGFALPPLEIRHEIVAVDRTVNRGSQLFRTPDMNATTMHREMRLTAPDRAERLASIINASTDIWTAWCNTNYEADELIRRIPDAIEIRGSDSIKKKEQHLKLFSAGQARVLVTKPSVAGYGLNWQHCSHTSFVGLSFSFEDFYQAMRRHYRYGQQHPVTGIVVAAETEGAVIATISRKMADYDTMCDAMVAASHRQIHREDLHLATYDPRRPIHLPIWLKERNQ